MPPHGVPLPAGAVVQIVELNGSGHRLYYVRLLADYALRQGYEVILTLSDGCVGTREFVTHLQSIAERVQILTVDRLSLEALSEHTSGLDPAVTVVPDADRFVYEIARGHRWNGPGRLSLLAMRERSEPRGTRFATAAATLVKRLAFWRASRAPGVTLSVLVSAVRSIAPGSNRVADPVTFVSSRPEGEALRTELRIPPSAFVFAVVGAIDERKNVPLVIEALSRLTRDPRSGIVFLLAGRIAPSVRAEVEMSISAGNARGITTIVVDEVLDDHRFDSVIALADCIVLAHSNDGPSGILGKAAAAGTRVLAAGSETLRRDCDMLGAGGQWTVLTLEALEEGLASIRTAPRPAPRAAPTADQFAATLLRP